MHDFSMILIGVGIGGGVMNFYWACRVLIYGRGL